MMSMSMSVQENEPARGDGIQLVEKKEESLLGLSHVVGKTVEEENHELISPEEADLSGRRDSDLQTATSHYSRNKETEGDEDRLEEEVGAESDVAETKIEVGGKGQKGEERQNKFQKEMKFQDVKITREGDTVEVLDVNEEKAEKYAMPYGDVNGELEKDMEQCQEEESDIGLREEDETVKGVENSQVHAMANHNIQKPSDAISLSRVWLDQNGFLSGLVKTDKNPAVDVLDRVYRKGIWMLPELMALQNAKKQGLGRFGYRTRNNKPEKERWHEIENVLWGQGIQRSADQCRSRWEYIAREFRKILEYENFNFNMEGSYWRLAQVERKERDLPINFHHELYQAMAEWMGMSKASNSNSPVLSLPSPGMASSSNPSEHDTETDGENLHVERPSNYKNNLKKRKVATKSTDKISLSMDPSNRSVCPREITPFRGDDGSLLLCNCTVIRLGPQPIVNKGEHILIKNKQIAYVGPSSFYASQMVDLGGRYVMPGLCDAHVHVTAVTSNLHDLSLLPPSLITARAAKVLKDMLMRGFTTVRDAGGCDWGLAKAVEEGTILGPRILFSGHALSQTGGHGDFRLPNEEELCCSTMNLGRVCDGVSEVRKAARDELRKGANQIKIMVSGGVASPSDHLQNLQFSSEEISAIVEEANHAGKYVCAHAYTAAAAKRAVELGVRSIEHGNLLDEECLDLIKRKGAFLVPTLVTYDQIRRNGETSGMPTELVAKVGNILEKGLEVIALAESKGLNICFGTDLLGSMHEHQLLELSLRSKVQSAASILRSATTTCAELFRMDGKVGVITEGAFADILVLEKNPLVDVHVLEEPSNILMMYKEGEAVKVPKGMVTKIVDGRMLSQIL